MLRKKSGEIEWLEFEILQGIPHLKAGVFLRHGGISQRPYTSFNLGANTKDLAEHVIYHRKQVQELFHFKEIVTGNQVHGVHAKWIQRLKQDVGNCDILLTDLLETGLLVTHADCQAAIFYDPLRKAIANTHVGWRGNVGNAYRETVRVMHKAFGSNPADLLVCISPSLGPKRAEFKEYKRVFPQAFWKYQVTPFHFDLWALTKDQLEEVGVLSSHIEIARMCTYCNAEDFYSYRRDQITGRNGTIIGFTEKAFD
ncbi:MAG: purine-nucleoside/S-methyl-5-thioadenosine phosphorylase / adenosine deaminase [Chlamydiota bacterium]|jgi:YfiH family protein|nr:purine-nucleoside/S-methyl-5-thioadenosine phosphorylase / adenosine deaminase [Chlamydiota bacterium]